MGSDQGIVGRVRDIVEREKSTELKRSLAESVIDSSCNDSDDRSTTNNPSRTCVVNVGGKVLIYGESESSSESL